MDVDELAKTVLRGLMIGNYTSELALSILVDRLKKLELANVTALRPWLSEDPDGTVWGNQTTQDGSLISITWDSTYGCARAYVNGEETSSHQIGERLRNELIELVREQQAIDRQEAATIDD